MSSQPAAIAEAARKRSTPLHRGLPEEITIWEILVRLPSKALLRCRAVCRAWRRATSARDFLLAHHGRQPSLPVVYGYENAGGHYYQSFHTLDHRAADAQLQHVVRLDEIFSLEASCDGLFILSTHGRKYYVRNPANRQYARLQEIDGFKVLGMYQHRPTGEYRLLLCWHQMMRYDNPAFDGPDGSYVFALGSGQPQRHIGCLEVEVQEEMMFYRASLLFRGNLHWHLSEDNSRSNMIMAFDTIDESFSHMPSPVDEVAGLFEMDGMLGMFRFNDAATNIDLWVLEDYENAVWAFKCRVELPVADIRAQFENFDNYRNAVVTTSCNGDVLVLVGFSKWLLQVDIHGKLVASFHREGLDPTKFRLKQTLVPHNFFLTL